MIKGITTKRSGIDEFHCSNAEEAIRNIDEKEIMRTHEKTKQNQRASHPQNEKYPSSPKTTKDGNVNGGEGQ